MDTRTLNTIPERQRLIYALRGNAKYNLAILLNKQTTEFVGTNEDISDDEEVVSAIKSVPCHY